MLRLVLNSKQSYSDSQHRCSPAPKHNAISLLALGYTQAIYSHTSSSCSPIPSPSPSPSRGLLPLLLLHLSPRRKNHLLPLPLQVRLALGTVLAPRLALGLVLLSGCLLPELRRQVISRDEVRVCGLGRSGCTSRGCGGAGCRDGERCRSLYPIPVSSYPSTQDARQQQHIHCPVVARSGPARSWRRRCPRCAAGPRQCRGG